MRVRARARCLYSYMYVHTCVCVHICIYIYIYIHIHIYVYTYRCLYSYIHACTYIYTYTHIHIYIHIYSYMYMYMYVYMYIYILPEETMRNEHVLMKYLHKFIHAHITHTTHASSRTPDCRCLGEPCGVRQELGVGLAQVVEPEENMLSPPLECHKRSCMSVQIVCRQLRPLRQKQRQAVSDAPIDYLFQEVPAFFATHWTSASQKRPDTWRRTRGT